MLACDVAAAMAEPGQACALSLFRRRSTGA